ncbi:hypothetical protein ACHAXA_006123 [Cyclostephanos tholiformis]|uniref:Uncharacterized protein n=1 Tax=Cyclostephanos tholiformis TaxID=382380 RepID=A0ABD3RAX7_9STRA
MPMISKAKLKVILFALLPWHHASTIKASSLHHRPLSPLLLLIATTPHNLAHATASDDEGKCESCTWTSPEEEEDERRRRRRLGRRRRRKRRRDRRGIGPNRRRLPPPASSSSSSSSSCRSVVVRTDGRPPPSTNGDYARELGWCISLRERWIDVLSSGRYDDHHLNRHHRHRYDDDENHPMKSINNDNDNDNNYYDGADSMVRPMSREERSYYREAEILADRLLGFDDGGDDDDIAWCEGNGIADDSPPRGESRPMSKSIPIVSSVALAMIVGVMWTAMSSSDVVRRTVTSISSSITPHLLPSIESLSSMTIAVRGYALQAQAILHSAPYLLRHVNRLRPPPLLPLLLRILRKCIILEAWRHIWITTYKLTRYVRRSMTLHNARAAYHRIFPPWIRRGVKSMFQSLVQAHVAGAVGDMMGSASFEGVILWSSSSSSSSSTGGDDGGGSGLEYYAVDDGIDFVSSSISDSSGEGGVQNAIQEALSEFADSSAGEAVESLAEAGVIDALIVEVGEMS